MTHEFWIHEGDLYRDKEYAEPFRKDFQLTFSRIDTTAQFKATLRNGAYAWPGGYPLFFVLEDGESLCFKCAKKEAKQIIASIREKSGDGWGVIDCQINDEDPNLQCCHCNSKIESAYGSEEEEE